MLYIGPTCIFTLHFIFLCSNLFPLAYFLLFFYSHKFKCINLSPKSEPQSQIFLNSTTEHLITHCNVCLDVFFPCGTYRDKRKCYLCNQACQKSENHFWTLILPHFPYPIRALGPVSLHPKAICNLSTSFHPICYHCLSTDYIISHLRTNLLKKKHSKCKMMNFVQM